MKHIALPLAGLSLLIALALACALQPLAAPPPTPEFRALPVPTDTATPRPTWTPPPTYTPYPSPTPAPMYTVYPTPMPTADRLEYLYDGAYRYCMFVNVAMGISFDCLEFVRELYEGGWHEVEVPGYEWPLVTPTAAGFWDDPAGAGEASPKE